MLISVDEVTNSEYIRIFASSFQIFLRNDYPIFLLMTGLYENIYNLQNDKVLTFLYRAPKLILEPLNYTAIRKQYMDIFSLDIDAAGELASLTKGYPFAFQVLGYLYWENRNKKTLEQILPEYDQYLDEYVYSKIWSELSDLDKKIVTEMSLSGETQVKALRERLDMKSELFSVYRERLKRKGVIISKEYGKVTLALPRFDEFVKYNSLCNCGTQRLFHAPQDNFPHIFPDQFLHLFQFLSGKCAERIYTARFTSSHSAVCIIRYRQFSFSS